MSYTTYLGEKSKIFLDERKQMRRWICMKTPDLMP
jgi:hypothetical protein